MGAAASKAYTPAIMSKAGAYVDLAISSNKVVVFSKTYCPYCTKAKRALNRFVPADKYKVIELDKGSVEGIDPNAIQSYLGQLTGGTSVPRVFLGGEFIGGGDDTERLANNGQLEIKLKALQLA